MKNSLLFLSILAIGVLASCKKEEEAMEETPTPMETALNPATAPRASVDRFSATAGHLMIRDASNGLPAANAAINFDNAPFITKGFGPSGEIVEYYNFDVQTTEPAPIYVLFASGSSTPVAGQLNIVNVKPGDGGYNDFWRMVKVTVPAGYVANTVTSESEIISKGYALEETNALINCPIVPEGSTANKRLAGESSAISMGWYRDQIVYYFTFMEAPMMVNATEMVPVSPIYVTFNVNPPTGGPASGFVVESGTMQTHNVLATLPGDTDYSPLWYVNVFDNADFSTVDNLSSAEMSTILGNGVATVNCPVVSIN
jgi:hypothetical protein